MDHMIKNKELFQKRHYKKFDFACPQKGQRSLFINERVKIHSPR